MALLDHVERDDAATSRRSFTAVDRSLDRQWTAFLAGAFNLDRVGNDNRAAPDDGAPELDCLLHVLPPARLEAARLRARELGIGADQVLIASGAIEETAYLRRLAIFTGLTVETFGNIKRADTPLRDRQIAQAAQLGILPLIENGRLTWVLSPRRLTARTLCRLVAQHPDIRRRARLASSAAMQRFLQHQGGPALTEIAVRGLTNTHPEMSAAPADRKAALWRQRLTRGTGVAGVLLLPPLLTGAAWSVLLALFFLGFIGCRLVGSLWPRRAAARQARVSDAELPVYTVVAALHREATSVAPLLRAIEALDYPREKLDVIMVIEPDDPQTRDAIDRLGNPPHLRVLTAPAIAPRTKPKALNCALPFARGSLVAIFDAEDRPEPNQLRAALQAFECGGPQLVCVQASLCIDNLTHSWLSRMFAAEYAGQFDVFLPGIAELRLPLPLGGSSNHFRTAALRAVGGWDPYNVTEDADLGFRLARFGFRSATIASTTFEEAPIRFDGWLRQRTRWMKGWVQTWSVHMRRPWRLWRDIGPGGFVALNLTVSGNVLAALAHPVLLVELFIGIPALAADPTWDLAGGNATLHRVAIVAGYASTIAIGWLGLRQRGRLRDGWILALTPLYWVCLSIAAWRAVAQYVWNPYRWEKTEHGLARRATPAPERDYR